MRILLLLFLLFAVSAKAQPHADTNRVWLPDFVLIPDFFYTDVSEQYLAWVRQPESFAFRLYDKWGNVLFEETKDPGFAIEFNGIADVKEITPFVLILEWTMPDRQSFRVQQTVYTLSSPC